MTRTVQVDGALERAQAVLQTTFGYGEFRGAQAAIIEQVLGGGDALVLMPTGGGKSLCYQIPAMLRPGVGVVVSPLIALMQDQVDALLQLGVKAAFLNSSLTLQEAAQVERDLLSGDLDLLYVAPERLLTPRFLDLLTRSRVALFAIDEAHCVSQWGHDFRPEYIGLSLLAERFPEIPRIALTATADDATRREMVERLSLGEAQQFVSSFDRPNIRYTVVPKQGAKQQLLTFYRDAHEGDAGIVYCLSRRSVDETASWLTKQGVNALPYHAGLAAAVRQRHQARFLREDGLVMVATIAFGMGIDKPDVRFVAHLDLPKSLESYYQETGRAGRDGEAADAFMTYGLEDVVSLRRMLAGSAAPDAVKRTEAGKLEALLGYCESARCRRQVLLAYFGETLAEPCGNCDTCLTPVDTWDGTVAAQKALSTVVRTGQRFGAGHVIDVLLGKETPRVKSLGHHTLSTYGIGKEHSERAWRGVLRQLVAGGYLTTDPDGYGTLKLSSRSTPVLKGQETVQLRHDPTPQAVKGALKGRVAGPGSTLNGGEASLFEALRTLRAALAKEQEVPAYVVFDNKTLVKMAELKPRSLAELRRVPGVGEVKLERYGKQFLAVLTEQPTSHLSATYLETHKLVQQGLTPAEVAETRELAVSTILQHCAALVAAGSVSVSQATGLSDPEIGEIMATHQTLSEEEQSKLKPLFERLHGRYDYGILRCVLEGKKLEPTA